MFLNDIVTALDKKKKPAGEKPSVADMRRYFAKDKSAAPVTMIPDKAPKNIQHVYTRQQDEDEDVKEVKQRLDAKCWTGKHKEGTKIKGGVRVNNCVPNESKLSEFATGGGDSNDYLHALASAWYNGTFNTGSLQKGIKSQQDVEKILRKGIICADGKTRKYYIDYNADFDGVDIVSYDYYEYDDGEIDSRTGKPWSAYDHIEYHDSELDEGMAEGQIQETFDQPYPMTWEHGDGSYDALVRLPDGNNLSIMFDFEPGNHTRGTEDVWKVVFWRNHSLEVTGEGDAQKIFATVLSAIQQFIKKEHPERISFSASKEVESGRNSLSRSKLYDRLVQRYANSWGYNTYIDDYDEAMVYTLTSKDKPGVAESFNSKKEVIDHFVKQGKTAAAGAAAWERGYRGQQTKLKAPVKKTDPRPQQKYWWQDVDEDSWHDGKNAWSSEHNQWTAENLNEYPVSASVPADSSSAISGTPGLRESQQQRLDNLEIQWRLREMKQAGYDL